MGRNAAAENLDNSIIWYDDFMSESSEGLSPVGVEQSKPTGVFGNFRQKFLRKTPGKPASVIEEATAENNSVPVGREFQFSTENLRPAESLFFHTAPAESLDSLRNYGLFSAVGDPNIGRSIGYSLFFGFEREVIRRKRGVQALSDLKLDVNVSTPDNYVLTLWKMGPDLKRVRKGALDKFMDVKSKPKNTAEIPEGFVKNSPMGDLLKELAPQDVRKLDPGYFVAAVPLNRVIRDEILKGMVLTEDGRMTADQIEQNLLTVLEKQNVALQQGVNLGDVAHRITVSIEKDLMRYGVASSLKQAESFPEPALWKALVYRNNSNDPVTATYLEKVIDKMTKIIRQKDSQHGYKSEEILQKFHKDLESLQKGEGVPPVERKTEMGYYGTPGIRVIVERLRQKLNLLAA